MSPPKKQELMAEVEGTESEDNRSDVEEDEVNMNNEVVNCELDGRNPEDSDFHGIKLLLQQLFLKAHINLSELTDLIIGQNYVGSVIKQSFDENEEEDEEEDQLDENSSNVFGITTVINLTDKKNFECVSQLRSLLLDLCSEHGTDQSTSMIRSILSDDSKPMGLIINERIINISPKVSVPLLESLVSEMKRAHEKQKSRFDFSYYVFICKIKKIEGKALKKMKKKGKSASGDDQELFWENGEEEIIDEEADCRFEFNVKDESDTGLGGKWTEDDILMTPYRRVLVLSASKLPRVIDRIKDAVNFDPSCLKHSKF